MCARHVHTIYPFNFAIQLRLPEGRLFFHVLNISWGEEGGRGRQYFTDETHRDTCP